MAGPRIDRDLISNRTKCYIFDIDGVLADVKNILMTHKDSYKKQCEQYEQDIVAYQEALKVYNKKLEQYKNGQTDTHPMGVPKEPVQPTKYDLKKENKVDFDYFYNNLIDATPIVGNMDLFISLAQANKVFLLTGRSEYSKNSTIQWLEKVITEIYGKEVYRRINFQLIMRDGKDTKTSGAQYKREKIMEITKTYSIQLILEDCPEIVKMYTDLGFLVLSPNREYLKLGQE